jgi:hypothetical protein
MHDPDGGSCHRAVMRSLDDPLCGVPTELILQDKGTGSRSLYNCFRKQPVGQCPTDPLRLLLIGSTG